MRPVTARGFRDVLPREASQRERVVLELSSVFSAWGYQKVETPVVEMYAMLEDAAGDLEGTAFRLVDSDGRLLALRPDMTMSIARLVASRMSDDPGTKRIRYVADVFREHESLRGQSRQFTQVGVEIVGASGAEADAELIVVLVEALTATGLTDFTVALGDVAVLNALVDAAGADDVWKASVLRAAHESNLVEFDRLAAEPGVEPAIGAALRDVIRLRGGAEAIRACEELLAPLGMVPVVARLRTTWSLLAAAQATEHVVIEFGVMRSFDYYTGLVFEAYAPGLGVPLGGGGRYDNLLSHYGDPVAAAGFALGLERLTMVLAEQEGARTQDDEAVPVLIGGEADAVFERARVLRADGVSVTLGCGLLGEDLEREAERLGAKAVEA